MGSTLNADTKPEKTGYDGLPKEMKGMKIRNEKTDDHEDIEPAIARSNGAKIGQMIVTTLNGQNGQRKQKLSFMLEHVVGTVNLECTSGVRFGNLSNDDPKQWRMYADFIGSATSIFDLCTPLYLSYFLPLASLRNLAKGVARGLKDPSFPVIQNHFVSSGNFGDIAAKEEVWEVAVELLGLALGIIALVVKSYVYKSRCTF